MLSKRLIILGIVLLALFLGTYLIGSQPGQKGLFGIDYKDKPFTLGLDLSGGTHLIYDADTSLISASDKDDALGVLRDVIERRVNLFGVSEPIVQISHGLSGEDRLLVDLPGVTDVEEAIKMIGETPLLEFKIENPNYDPNQKIELDQNDIKNGTIDLSSAIQQQYIETELSGRYLKHATLEFNQTTREPSVSIQFDDTGSELFEKITSENVGKTVAIYLDGTPISTPVVREKISGGQATISGNFTPDEAKKLVARLNSGALPVPVTLVSTETIGASLGGDALRDGGYAGLIGFLVIFAFFLLYYRLPGLVAGIALFIYAIVMLFLFKIVPVTMSAAGIAGFVISLGLAVDANVLIFARVKEEIKSGKGINEAFHEGFRRAWPSIRDSNMSTLISTAILFWFGTSLIKGFALTFGIGVLVSMVSAITVTRIFLYSFGELKSSKLNNFLFGSGFMNKNKN